VAPVPLSFCFELLDETRGFVLLRPSADHAREIAIPTGRISRVRHEDFVFFRKRLSSSFRPLPLVFPPLMSPQAFLRSPQYFVDLDLTV